MDLEEKTLDQVGDRCEECGAKLTPAEIQAAMESGGPALCSIHAAEDEPGLAVDQTTGKLGVCFYDRRRDPKNFRIDRECAKSANQGIS